MTKMKEDNPVVEGVKRADGSVCLETEEVNDLIRTHLRKQMNGEDGKEGLE